MGQFGREHDHRRAALRGGPAFLGLHADPDILGVERDRAAGQLESQLASRLEIYQQLATVGLAQELAKRGQLFPQPRPQPFQVGQHGVSDVLVGPLCKFHAFDVQLVADQRHVVLQPRLMRVVAQDDLDQ